MSFFAVVVVVLVALLVIIAINLVYQHHEAKEAQRRKELARQRAIVEETEEVLSQAALIPMSNALLQTLNARILDALNTSKQLSGSGDYDGRINHTRSQLSALEAGQLGQESIDLFQLPGNEKQTLVLIQTLKKLKPILRNEHNKGRLAAEVFTDEELKVDKLQLRIHIEVLLNRARNLVNARQHGSAKMLLSKITLALNNQVLASPEYRSRMQAKTNELLQAIESTRVDAEKKDKPKDDLDELFQPKKKW